MRVEVTTEPSRGVWYDRLRPCIDKPGTWVRFEMRNLSTANGTAAELRRGARRRPPGDWSFAARKEHGRAWLYACYRGDTGPTGTEASLDVSEGYTSREVCLITGASYRQADYLSRMSTAVRSGDGMGNQRRWTSGEARVLWAYSQLTGAGITVGARAIIEAHADEIRNGSLEIKATNGPVTVIINMATCPIEATS